MNQKQIKTDIKNLIDDICLTLSLNSDIKNKSIEIIDNLSSTTLTNFSKEEIAASSIYFASFSTDENVTQKNISKLMGIRRSRVKQCYMSISLNSNITI